MTRKGQGFIEYLIVIGIIFMFFIGFFSVPPFLLGYYSKSEIVNGIPILYLILATIISIPILIWVSSLYRMEIKEVSPGFEKFKKQLKYLLFSLLFFLLYFFVWYYFSIFSQSSMDLWKEIRPYPKEMMNKK